MATKNEKRNLYKLQWSFNPLRRGGGMATLFGTEFTFTSDGGFNPLRRGGGMATIGQPPIAITAFYSVSILCDEEGVWRPQEVWSSLALLI